MYFSKQKLLIECTTGQLALGIPHAEGEENGDLGWMPQVNQLNFHTTSHCFSWQRTTAKFHTKQKEWLTPPTPWIREAVGKGLAQRSAQKRSATQHCHSEFYWLRTKPLQNCFLTLQNKGYLVLISQGYFVNRQTKLIKFSQYSMNACWVRFTKLFLVG